MRKASYNDVHSWSLPARMGSYMHPGLAGSPPLGRNAKYLPTCALQTVDISLAKSDYDFQIHVTIASKIQCCRSFADMLPSQC